MSALEDYRRAVAFREDILVIADADVEAARAVLAADCPHPPEAVHAYPLAVGTFDACAVCDRRRLPGSGEWVAL